MDKLEELEHLRNYKPSIDDLQMHPPKVIKVDMDNSLKNELILYMTPLELLEKELLKYEKALEKSIKAHDEGKIDIGIHEDHVRNLEPKISAYRLAIRILVTYM
jgi:hypothetical protein